MNDLTNQQIADATGANSINVETNWPLVLSALRRFEIAAPLVQVGMAATIAIETGNFTPKTEKRASADRQPDLWKAQEKYWPSGYYGRGFIQLTWRDNYAAAGKAIGADLLANPDHAAIPSVAAHVAAWFFKANKIHNACQDRDWRMVRRLVNGPNFAADAKTLTRFLLICKALTEAPND